MNEIVWLTIIRIIKSMNETTTLYLLRPTTYNQAHYLVCHSKYSSYTVWFVKAI